MAATTFPISPPENWTFDRENSSVPDAMTPVSRAGLHDASRWGVPIQIAAAITGTVLVMGGVFWQTTGRIDARLDVVVTKIDAAADMSKLRDDNTKAQLEAVKDEMRAVKAQQQLLQLQLQQIQLENAALKGKR